MYLLLIFFVFVTHFLSAMDQPFTLSGVEEKFMQRVLELHMHYNFTYLEEKKAEFEKREAAVQKEKKDIRTWLSIIEFREGLFDEDQDKIKKQAEQLRSSLIQIELEEKYHLKEREQCESEFQEKETYEQFIRWRQRPPLIKLRDLKFLFNKMALENNIEGMQAIEALSLEWKLIAHPDEKSEKLDYLGALIDAADHGKGNATEYLVNKKNISLKNMCNTFLGQICWGNWGSTRRCISETQQAKIARAMIKKRAPSRLNDIRMYLLIAQESGAPARLINYLKEVEISRISSI